ncbi:mechanosensitive ion channel family protein [Entomohabitans teleogrylli]|uniref:mechanosensitive ion channel family protein n=1 Tax=Entomohabitans teleogrylli TaxID=1384589 RepID=UPI00073D6581|nr:mechanosensitive ion channel family protein [Entomohabitans teleogrylli]
MNSEFLTNNILSLMILFACFILLPGMRIYSRSHPKFRHGVLIHTFQFLLWSAIIIILGSYADDAISDFKLTFINPTVVSLVCTSLIAALLLRKLFLMINRLEKNQVNKGSDVTSARMISRVLKITLIVAMVLLYGEHFGMSLSGLLTFGGIGGIAIGMAGKDILSNFFSGIMLYFDRPFNIGDWIRSPDRNIEGTVAEIGWRTTKIITFDQRPLYIPNSIFAAISVENPGRMTNRRINTILGLRYEDADKIAVISDDIRNMLKTSENIDQNRTLLVYFNGFGDSSLNIMVYCFTRTTLWAEWLEIQQGIFLKMIEIVHGHGADFAFPSQTLYMQDSNAAPAAPTAPGQPPH